MLPDSAQIERDLARRNLATYVALPDTTDEERARCIELWVELRERHLDYAVYDCERELGAFETFAEALTFWRAAPRQYGRNSVLWICNLYRCDGGNPGLTDEELDALEAAREERACTGNR